MAVKHTVLPDGHPSTVAFTVLAQLCGPKANETEIGAALSTENCERRSFEFGFDLKGSFFNVGSKVGKARQKRQMSMELKSLKLLLNSVASKHAPGL